MKKEYRYLEKFVFLQRKCNQICNIIFELIYNNKHQ